MPPKNFSHGNDEDAANAPEEVTYAGIHNAGPEGFACALLLSTRRQVVLPIWMSPEGAAAILAHEGGSANRRPDAIDTLKYLVELFDAEISNVQITDYSKGVAYCYIALTPDVLVDSRPSDALALAQLSGCPVFVSPNILQQYGIPLEFLREDNVFDLSSYLPEGGLEDVVVREESAVGDSLADESFADLMKNLGLDEQELLGAFDEDEGKGPGEES